MGRAWFERELGLCHDIHGIPEMILMPCLSCGVNIPKGTRRCWSCRKAKDAVRNASPERVALYGGDWAAESRTIRMNNPRCSVCGFNLDLTVDHPTRKVFCRSCHGRLEAQRRASAPPGINATSSKSLG